MDFKYRDLTEKIIGCFYKVYNELGSGFVESIYEKAVMIELESIGLFVESQKEIKVYYKGLEVGIFKSDIIVENKVIIELKAVNSLIKVHEVQLVNYLKSTGIEIGLLVNFGKKIEFKRKIHKNPTNQRYLRRKEEK